MSDESRLSFAASFAFLTVGGIGWIANRISPGSNVLSALLAVGGFYMILGVISLFKKSTAELAQEETLRAPSPKLVHRPDQGEGPKEFERQGAVQSAA